MIASSALEDERPALDVSLVQRHLINQLWPKVEPLLAKATEISEGRYEIDDLHDKLINEDDWHLWCVYEPDLTVVAAITSTFTHYPQGLALHGQFLGGDRLHDWQDMFCEMFDRWARDHGAKFIEFTGRAGWVRPLQRNGYRPVFTIYQRDLT